MNIEECYEKMGGKYADAIARLQSVKLIERFIGKFLEDKSFEMLCEAIQSGNREEAFRAAHTLKGISANLSFTALFNSADKLTEELRPETSSVSEETMVLLEGVRRDYEITADAIRSYLSNL